MSMATIRAGILRNTLRNSSRTPSDSLKRRFSSSGHHDELYEAKESAKWEKITYIAIAVCTIMAGVNLAKGHHHFEEPPQYSYMHIRNKEFPWGPDGLFETKHH